MSKKTAPLDYSNAICSQGHEVAGQEFPFGCPNGCDGYPQDRDTGLCLWCLDSGMFGDFRCICPAAENIAQVEG